MTQLLCISILRIDIYTVLFSVLFVSFSFDCFVAKKIPISLNRKVQHPALCSFHQTPPILQEPTTCVLPTKQKGPLKTKQDEFRRKNPDVSEVTECRKMKKENRSERLCIGLLPFFLVSFQAPYCVAVLGTPEMHFLVFACALSLVSAF